MKLISALAAGLFLTMAITSCSKDGATGPAGPTGPTGPTGPGGGGSGSGNTLIKDTMYTYTSADWSSAGSYDYIYVNDPQITDTVANGGTVNVYWSATGYNWNPLPEISGSTTFGFNINATSKTYLPADQLTLFFAGGGNANTSYSETTIYVRIVSISAAGMKKYPSVNWKDYTQVKAVLANEKVN